MKGAGWFLTTSHLSIVYKPASLIYLIILTMEFLFPEKVRVINRPDDYPVQFKNAAGANVAAAAAVEADINFFGKVKTSFVNRVSLVRGLTPKSESWSITAANAAEITLAGAIANNSKAYVRINFIDDTRKLRNARPQYQFGRDHQIYSVVLKTGFTPENFLYELHRSINFGKHRERDFQITATATNLNDTTRTADAIQIQMKERGLFVRKFDVLDETGQASSEVSVFAPVKLTPYNRGVNFGFDLEFLEKVDYGNSLPYFFDDKERFDQTALYTAVFFETEFSRPEPRPTVYNDRKRFILYIKETAENATYIDNLADFFLTDVATRMPNLLSDGLSVAFNDSTALTNTNAASSATNLDSDHATLTAIFGTLAGTDPKYVSATTVALDDTLDTFLLANFKTNA